MSQQKRRFEASAKHRRLFLKQNPLAPRDGSGGRPYADSSSTCLASQDITQQLSNKNVLYNKRKYGEAECK